MTADNSLLVDCRMTTVPAGCHPYPEGAPWADPDVAHASRLMRQVTDQPEVARRVGQTARNDIRTKHTPETSGRRLREYLDNLRRTPARGPHSLVVPAPSFVPDGPKSSGPAGFVGPPEPSRPETPPMTSPIESSLQRVSDHLAPSRIYAGTGLRARLRDFLFRLLRPYWWHERQVDEALVQAIRDLDSGAPE